MFYSTSTSCQNSYHNGNVSDKATPATQEGDFVTASLRLKQALAQLPCEGSITRMHSFLLLGPQGSGHTSFARHAWRRVGAANRPFVVANCRQIRGRRDINRLFHKARTGDLYLEDVDHLNEALVEELRQLCMHDPYLRIIGSIKSSTTTLPADEPACMILFPRVVSLSALRERKDDIPLIAKEVLRSFAGLSLSKEALQALQGYSWPREVSQLVHCLRQSAESCLRQGQSVISDAHIKLYLREGEQLYDYSQMLNSLKIVDLCEVAKRWGVKDTLRMIEGAVIAATLRETYSCTSHAAAVLKVPINTLASRKKVLAKHIKAFDSILESSDSYELMFTPDA